MACFSSLLMKFWSSFKIEIEMDVKLRWKQMSNWFQHGRQIELETDLGFKSSSSIDLAILEFEKHVFWVLDRWRNFTAQVCAWCRVTYFCSMPDPTNSRSCNLGLGELAFWPKFKSKINNIFIPPPRVVESWISRDRGSVFKTNLPAMFKNLAASPTQVFFPRHNVVRYQS